MPTANQSIVTKPTCSQLICITRQTTSITGPDGNLREMYPTSSVSSPMPMQTNALRAKKIRLGNIISTVNGLKTIRSAYYVKMMKILLPLLPLLIEPLPPTMDQPTSQLPRPSRNQGIFNAQSSLWKRQVFCYFQYEMDSGQLVSCRRLSLDPMYSLLAVRWTRRQLQSASIPCLNNGSPTIHGWLEMTC